MRKSFLTILVISCAFCAVSAQAEANLAAIGQIQGKVLVNQGSGFAVVVDGTALRFGDQVMVGKGGAALISYAGCDVSLTEGKLITIPKTAPCKASTVVVTPASYTAPVDPLPFLLVGSTALVVGGILILGQNNNAKPISAP